MQHHLTPALGEPGACAHWRPFRTCQRQMVRGMEPPSHDSVPVSSVTVSSGAAARIQSQPRTAVCMKRGRSTAAGSSPMRRSSSGASAESGSSISTATACRNLEPQGIRKTLRGSCSDSCHPQRGCGCACSVMTRKCGSVGSSRDCVGSSRDCEPATVAGGALGLSRDSGF